MEIQPRYVNESNSQDGPTIQCLKTEITNQPKEHGLRRKLSTSFSPRDGSFSGVPLPAAIRVLMAHINRREVSAVMWNHGEVRRKLWNPRVGAVQLSDLCMM